MFPGAGIIGGCALPGMSSGNSGSLEEQEVCLTAEPSFQLPHFEPSPIKSSVIAAVVCVTLWMQAYPGDAGG